MDERVASQYGLEFLGKLLTLTEPEEDFRRAAYAPLSQNDGLYDPALEKVASAIHALSSGNTEVAKKVLKEVQAIEGKERYMSNFSGYLNAHHPTSLAGWAALTPDMSMEDNNKAVKFANERGITTGTSRHTLLSGTKSFFHPAAHTNPRTQTTGGYKASIGTNEKFRQASPEERIKAATSALLLEQDISNQAFRMAGEQEFRQTLAKFLQIPVDQLISTEQDTTLRKGANRTIAASNAMRIPEPIARGIAMEIKRRHSPEIMIPIMEAHPRKGQLDKFNQYQLLKDPESDAMDRYLRIERPGLGEALDQLQSQVNRSGRRLFL